MYLLWLHVKYATVHNKNYLNITVASQILAKYISSISSTSVSQTTSIIFKDLEITGSKGITLTLLFFLTYTFLLLLINVTVSLRVPMRLFFFFDFVRSSQSHFLLVTKSNQESYSLLHLISAG